MAFSCHRLKIRALASPAPNEPRRARRGTRPHLAPQLRCPLIWTGERPHSAVALRYPTRDSNPEVHGKQKSPGTLRCNPGLRETRDALCVTSPPLPGLRAWSGRRGRLRAYVAQRCRKVRRSQALPHTDAALRCSSPLPSYFSPSLCTSPVASSCLSLHQPVFTRPKKKNPERLRGPGVQRDCSGLKPSAPIARTNGVLTIARVLQAWNQKIPWSGFVMRKRQHRHAVGIEYRLQDHALVVHSIRVGARSVRRSRGNRQEKITSMTLWVAQLQHAPDAHPLFRPATMGRPLSF